MSTHRDKHKNASRRGLVAAILAACALLVASSSALAGQDELNGGSVVIQLKSSHGLKLKPASRNLPITGGAVDPIDGSGTVQVSSKVSAKRGKSKTKLIITAFNLGSNGGPGTISAKIGKKKVAAFGKLTGGTVARDGWGAKISNITATIARKGAQALNRTFSSRKGARKSAGGGVKAGQPLGTVVSIATDPKTVEVVPGSGSIVLNTNAMGSFVSKLSQHCIDPLPTGSPAGVAPIAPATTSGIGGTTYTFPVSGGAVAPDFSTGSLITAGGQQITKNTSSNPLNPNAACAAAQPPVGAVLTSTNFQSEFDRNFLASFATLPDGSSIQAGLGTIDFSSGTRSIDPNTKQLTVTGANVTLVGLAADTLNRVFPNESGNASNDFASGDAIGSVDMTAKLR
jgi:hypothetical protein